MKKYGGARLSILLVSLILGLVLAAQFKNVQRVGGSVSLQRTEELTSEIQKLNQEITSQQDRIREMEQTIWEYESAAQNEGTLNETLFRDLERARMLAGLMDVEGPGVVVEVNAVSMQEPTGETRIVRNVYYDDLLRLVNELNAAGAEAIAINGERLTSTSEIRDAGNHIVINTINHSSPFVIEAIGNPDTLEAALMLLGGVADTLGVDLEIKIRREDSITISKYTGPQKYDFAQPVQ